MRLPTSHAALYEWHQQAMAGLDPVITEIPQCGWYQRKLIKGGVFVPARIWVDAEIDIGTGELLGPETYLCEVNGERRDAFDQWPWLCSNPITESEFDYLTKMREHAILHEPDLPIANPRKPVDWLRVPLPTFRKD